MLVYGGALMAAFGVVLGTGWLSYTTGRLLSAGGRLVHDGPILARVADRPLRLDDGEAGRAQIACSGGSVLAGDVGHVGDRVEL